MDNISVFLNTKWKNYFNWTFVYPWIIIAVSLSIMFFAIINTVSNMFATGSLDHISDFSVFSSMMTMTGGFLILFFLFSAAMIIYVIWFILASDTLFKLLGVNRWLGNTLNLIGIFLLPCLSFLILPIYFWIKVREYWLVRGIPFSWRAVV